ncbi:3-oxoacyl-(acyl-carrier-protein) reductase [Halococcus morrhuae DSM 1307]|uniref:3-oxoacyl-(Acyl-carrier-protein) reductase n=1 Tax=Halococcus morrhuae DSM 1307 TaxID=931277 RepID=M0MMC1_HALMO|nr:glucose 1-dehydrogenase [Halococcus morrhuae]EMA46847.1 3-oxoacyl-(acyl-carrier-protein) reductase [Halococcus morrhuae DSM 1307]
MTGKTSYDFGGETAFVTGSTDGIGRGIATALAVAGADVAVNARSSGDVETTAEALDARGEGTVIGVAADVGDPDELRSAIETAIDAFGSLTLLVNNAARWPEENSMVEASLDDWDRTMAVNARAQFHATKLVARHMIDEGIEGCIVNHSSQTGDRRAGDRGLYGVSKTTVNGLTWRLANDLAPHGIRVNAVSTDVTESRQLRYEAEIEARERRATTAEVLDEWGGARPLGRLGHPEDIADGVLFLASDKAEYVTGTVLRISGGGNLE